MKEPAGQLTVVVVGALRMVKEDVPVLPSWLSSPAHVAVAVTGPAEMLSSKSTGRSSGSSPTLLAVALHGSKAVPSYVTVVGSQMTVTVEPAAPIVIATSSSSSR